MSSEQFFFSVVVPTYNRADEITELLASLERQSLNKNLFEIIIVDDGSTDNTLEVVEKLRANEELNITLLKQDHQGPGKARNKGMREASGKYFVFIDSDCIADKNWLRAYYETVSKTLPGAFGGPDGVLPEFSPLQKAIDYSMTSFITTGGIRGHSKTGISKYYPRSFNMGVRSDVVEKIGGMGKLRHGQDIEYSNRILSAGEKVLKIPNAVVYHKRRISLKKFFRQVFNWGAARINLYKIDSKMLEKVHFFPALGTLLSVILILIALFFPSGRWIIFGGIILLLILGIHGVFKYKDFRVLFLIPLVIPVQIWGYGSGFIYAFVKRVILGGEEVTGFVKKYYN